MGDGEDGGEIGEGREDQEGGHACIITADLRYSIAETGLPSWC